MRKYGKKWTLPLTLGLAMLMALAIGISATQQGAQSVDTGQTSAFVASVNTSPAIVAAGDTQTKDTFALAQHDKKLTTMASQIAASGYTGLDKTTSQQAQQIADKKLTQPIATQQIALVGDTEKAIYVETPARLAVMTHTYTGAIGPKVKAI